MLRRARLRSVCSESACAQAVDLVQLVFQGSSSSSDEFIVRSRRRRSIMEEVEVGSPARVPAYLDERVAGDVVPSFDLRDPWAGGPVRRQLP